MLCLEGLVLYCLRFCANSELWQLVAAGLEGPINPDLIIENYGEMVPEVAGSLVVAKYSEPGLLKLVLKSLILRATYWMSYVLIKSSNGIHTIQKRKAPIHSSLFAYY